jgi:hypothetical protein
LYPKRIKAKNDRKAGSSCAAKTKKPRNRRYVLLDFTRRLFDENQPVPWWDAGLPGHSWYLNS